MPRFSVIVATHRRPQLLARALDSLLGQSFPCHQIVVVSDIADEASWRVCSERLRRHDRFVQRSGPPGPAPSRNLGLDLADGDYVLFLDDDDIFRADFLAQLAGEIARQPAPALFYTNCEVIYGDDPTAESVPVDLSGFAVDSIFIKNFIPNNCLAFPRAAVADLRFDPEIAYEDWEFILGACAVAPLRHLPISGPVIFKNAVPGEAGRGVNNRPRVVDCYRRIYRKHPAARPDIAEGRRQFLTASGIEVEADGSPRVPPKAAASYAPVCLPLPDAPIRVGLCGADTLRGLPWRELAVWGATAGLQFYALDGVATPPALDAVVVAGPPLADSAAAQLLEMPDVVRYLLAFDSPVARPEIWEAGCLARFDRVLGWSDSLADGGRHLKANFCWPPELPVPEPDEAMQRFFERKLATLVADAGESAHPQELYSHRLRTIRWFESEAPGDFDLYGRDWDAAAFPSYRGLVADKPATLAGYRFAICYENAQGYPGYISEQLLDCFVAGCVPVYGGPPNIGRWIPEDCFIPVGRFSTYAELHAHLRDMDVATYRGYLQRIAAFMRSPAAWPFTAQAFVETLAGVLAYDVRRQRGETGLPELRQAADGRLSLGSEPPDRADPLP